MPQELNQDPNELSQKEVDSNAAVLSFATKLSEQLLPKAQPQETGSPSDSNQKGEEMPTEEEKAPEIDLKTNNKEMEKTMDSKLEELRKEIKEMIKEEVSTIKESIEEALKEDEEE